MQSIIHFANFPLNPFSSCILMRITIRTRILLLFVGVALVQTLLLGSFFLTRHYQIQRNQYQNHLQDVTIALGSQIELYWNNTIREVYIASQQIERMAIKPYQQYNLLSNLQKSNPSFAALALYDINGSIQVSIAGSSDDSILNIFLQEDLYDIPYNSGKVFVTQIDQSPEKHFLVINVPIYFLDHSYIVGVISAVVSCSEFQDIIDPLIIPGAENIYILNSKGGVIAAKGDANFPIERFDLEENWNGERTISSTDYLTAFATVNVYDNPLEILTVVRKKTVLANSHTPTYFLFVPVLLMLLMALFVGWKTNKYIIAPLQRLASSSNVIPSTDSDFLPNGDVELQDVAHAMQDMNNHLQKSNDLLKKEIVLRKDGEKTAIQAQIDAEKANQAKSIFLSNMSHEVKTPLQAMTVLMDLLKDQSLNKKQDELLSIAILSGQRLQTIVDSLLELSLIESGKIKLHISTFSLSALLKEVVQLMKISANNKGITLSFEQDDYIPNTLQGDSGRIRQILINLINNSIRHTTGGTISVHAALQDISPDDEVAVLFTIKDSGSGISDELRKTIFDPFERGQLDSAKVDDGIGLGLAISKEFVSYMQGRIWLEKSDANGSVFCFTIQCKSVEEPDVLQDQLEDTHTTPQKLAGIRILLAEDDFINQRIISAFLEEYGASVGICENGEVLLSQLEGEIPDIILMDIRMPILNGLEATKRIRTKEAKNGLPHIPIIALTAESSYDFEEKCKLVGMDGFLTKPIPLDELTVLIGDLCRQRTDTVE